MLKCRTVPLLISRLLDGDLSVDTAAELASHLAVCKKCRRVENSYSAHRKLVAASFSDRPLPVDAMTALIARNRRKNTVPRFFACRFGLAGTGFTLMAAAAAVFFLSPPQRTAAVPPSFLLESFHPSTMCIPLSSLIYYEEFAGRAVHSQFVRVAPRRANFGTSALRQTVASYYESPLLGDNAAVATATGGTPE